MKDERCEETNDNKLEMLAEAIRRINNDERSVLCDLMYPIGLKLAGVPEIEPEPGYFVPKRNIRDGVLPLIEKIQFALKGLKRKELQELNDLIASEGLKFLQVVHTVKYVEP